MRLASSAYRLLSATRLGLTATLLAALCGLGLGSSAEAAKCPNVHIVLDRSGSMTASAPGPGGTRWSVAKDAIQKVLDKYDGKFPIGLSIFPNSGCDSQLVTEPAYKSKSSIIAAINAQGPNGSTPSAVAIMNARALKTLKDPDRKQFIIFITDGAPGCSGADTCPGTVSEVLAANMQKPSINTFVVGFGNGLSASDKQCMGQLADAGGKPAMSADRFYKADSADELNKALADIIEVVTGGGDVGMGGFCDDTCYSNGCSIPGQVCVAGECRDNPCSGVTCPKNSYCYTDGLSPGQCQPACAKRCPTGSRCRMGACTADPCAYACPAGQVCDANVKRCIKDPLCGMMAPEDSCKGTSSCRGGACADDPCRYITCPSNTRCVNWEGTCDLLPTPIMEEKPPTDNTVETDGRGSGGCSTIPGGAGNYSLAAAALLLVALLGARRRAL
jgi:Mg-chelatase subunit ChlD